MSSYLTAAAAVLAALFSGLSLLVGRRWHTRDLALERAWQQNDLDTSERRANHVRVITELNESLTEHINISFKIGRTCREGDDARKSGEPAKVSAAFDRAVALHVDYMDRMVYLRLFGSREVVSCAEQLHLQLDYLLDLNFSAELIAVKRRPFTKNGQLPQGLTDKSCRTECMKRREALINAARAYIDLPDDATIDRTI